MRRAWRESEPLLLQNLAGDGNALPPMAWLADGLNLSWRTMTLMANHVASDRCSRATTGATVARKPRTGLSEHTLGDGFGRVARTFNRDRNEPLAVVSLDAQKVPGDGRISGRSCGARRLAMSTACELRPPHPPTCANDYRVGDTRYEVANGST
jgi:hypothetical protein